MSYETSSSAKIYINKNLKDKELADEPLLDSGNYQEIAQQLKVQLDQLSDFMTSLNSNMQKYEQSQNRRPSQSKEDYLNEQDQRTRKNIEDLLRKNAMQISTIKRGLDHLSDIQVSGVKDNQARMREYNSIKSSLNEMTKKFETYAKRFGDTEELNLKNYRDSVLNPNKKLRERAEIEQIEDYLKERKEQLDKVHKLMGDVHSIAKDIGVEVVVQGKKIEEINTEMESAKENVEGGKEQLQQKRDRTIRGNKWIMFLFAGVLGLVLILLLVIFLRR
ncbi:syntaxin 12 [Stylonychia lemnae]|uniref:Syntaxin 12 n=1 Tax=Stylonychia lemnae TaxID=5949 RepID=A0A078AXK7_STYLE|nr:syntaxin 12 [Stylonychia lemnae]|eukprot:CDW85533.1 syntaxin 12 [Stylonychia lemnae]